MDRTSTSTMDRLHHGWTLWVIWYGREELDSPLSEAERAGFDAAAEDNEMGGTRPTVADSPFGDMRPEPEPVGRPAVVRGRVAVQQMVVAKESLQSRQSGWWFNEAQRCVEELREMGFDHLADALWAEVEVAA